MSGRIFLEVPVVSNVFDYLAWRGDITFASSPFCEVDNVILSLLSYVDYSGAVPDYLLGNPVKLSEIFKKHPLPKAENESSIAKKYEKLLEAVSETERFSNIYLAYFKKNSDKERTLQFAAVTFLLPDNTLFVAYRGTDGTLTGWKEDFTLSFSTGTVAQQYAVDYLNTVTSVYKGDIRIGGHSKGGNLSVYAGIFTSSAVRSRILSIYNNDGPGFVPEIVSRPEYKELEDRIITLIPQSSIVGLLLDRVEKVTIVKSSEITGFSQHDPISWNVARNSFVHLDDLSTVGKKHVEVVDNFLTEMTPDERKLFTSTLFEILDSTGAKTFGELTHDSFNNISAAVKTYTGLSREMKQSLSNTVKRLASSLMKSN